MQDTSDKTEKKESGGMYNEAATKVLDFVRGAALDPTAAPGDNEGAMKKKVGAIRRELHQKRRDVKRKQPPNGVENKPRRTRKVARCTSPSHFYVDKSEEQKYGPEFLQKLPDRHRVDNVLRAVASLYYHQKQVTDDASSVVETSNEFDQFDYSTLDFLLSPLRKPGVLDNWSPKEIALFEAGICSKGKDFHAIHKIIKTKTTNEIVDFYYNWKKSGHYQMWKAFNKPNEKFPSSRASQYAAINSKMRGYKPKPPKVSSSSQNQSSTSSSTSATSTAQPVSIVPS